MTGRRDACAALVVVLLFAGCTAGKIARPDYATDASLLPEGADGAVDGPNADGVADAPSADATDASTPCVDAAADAGDAATPCLGTSDASADQTTDAAGE